MNRFFLIALILISYFTLSIDAYANDTLNLQAYLEVIMDNHPLVKKAELNDELTAAYALKGRGALDPKLSSDYNTKYFSDTDYYTVWQSEAKIPTSLPIDFAIGYERNNGVFLNNENGVPTNGLVYGTINLSVLRGLLFDEQRYTIQQAELSGIKSQIEKDIVLREILYQAISAYINWTKAQNDFNINENYLQLVIERHLNVVQLFESGDIPAIDTIESRLNLNSAEKLLLLSKDKQIKATQKISLFIWNEDGYPLALNAAISPMNIELLIQELLELTLSNNPVLENDPLIRKLENEISSLELINRLEKENLKPQLDLKYNTILNLGKDEFEPSFTFNDYKYGVSFLYPLLNRKTKSELRLNDALIQQNAYDRTQYLGTLNSKYESYLSRRDIQSELLVISQEKVANSRSLYEAEQLKFSLGESSIFLLNSRERKLLESRIELIKNYEALGNILNDLYYIKLGQG